MQGATDVSSTPRTIPGCTIAAVTGSAVRDRRPLLMSNSDDPFETRTRLVVERPDDGYAFLATQIISPPPMVSWNNMHTRGVNSAGFAYTWSYVTPADEPNDERAIGIPYYQLGSLLLARAASVAEALALFERYPRAYHGNFLLADATGEICLVEVSTQSLFRVNQTRDGVLGRANHWTSGVQRSREDAALACSSGQRHQRINALLEEHAGQIDAGTLMQFCADHEGRDDPETGYSICAHGLFEAGGAQFGTVSSEIIDPVAHTLWYCYGWPCGESPADPVRQPFQQHSWGTYLPFALDAMEAGEYVTIDGRLTPRAIRYLRDLSGPQAIGAALDVALTA